MNEIIFVESIDSSGKAQKHAIIDRGNGEFTSMPKAVWDELEAQREQSGTLGTESAGN